MISGSDVWQTAAGATYIQLWTSSQFSSKFGRTFNNSRDCIVAMNCDARSQPNAAVKGCYYDSGTIGCYVEGVITGPIRIGYAAIFK